MFTITILINILLGIIAVLLFCLIASLHEFGHFITAKACGIRSFLIVPNRLDTADSVFGADAENRLLATTDISAKK